MEKSRVEEEETFYGSWRDHTQAPPLICPISSLSSGLALQKDVMEGHESRLHFLNMGLLPPLSSHILDLMLRLCGKALVEIEESVSLRCKVRKSSKLAGEQTQESAGAH